VGIIPIDGSDDSEIFLTVQLNDQKPLEIKSMYQQEKGNTGKNPEFYLTYEYQEVLIPGSAYVKIDVNKKGLIQNQYIGSTIIDLEERLFNMKWQNLDKKPVEKRNIEHPARGSRGRLEMWIDIIRPMDKQPQTVIFPKVQLPYELRVIVWQTKDCVIKDITSDSNDLFGRGCVKRGEDWKETDTHWFCRGMGSFNWRWKWEVNLPVDLNKNYGEDRFCFQLWDRDLIASNDLIGEIEINLNDHRMLKKVVTRKKAVQMRKRIKGSGIETNQLWYDVYHPSEVDDEGKKVSQGKALISFEIMPKEVAEKFPNGIGRSDPNFHPSLPNPVGRFAFDLLSPLAMLKMILGPKLYYRIWCLIWLTLLVCVFVFIIYDMIPVLLGIKISNLLSVNP